MSDTSSAFEAVEQLLRERDAVHGWLARLDAVGTATPEGVRTKVRADYERRLADLTNGLREHADTIAARLADDRAEHADLEQRATASRNALAEAELRHAVGEYSQVQFDGERTRHTSDLETFGLSIAAVADRIARLEAVEELTRRPVPREADSSVESPMPAGEAEDAAEVVEVSDASGTSATVSVGELASAETDALLSVFDEPPAAAPSRGPTTPGRNLGPLSFTPSGGGESPSPAPSGTPTVPPLGMPAAASSPPRFLRPGERLPVEAPPSPKPAPSPARSLLEEEIVATGPAPEPVAVPVSRTLRCGECGAMNKPLEWYCEKCGAELTAS